MYKALNLAQYIIKRQLKINKPIDNFRLNKLLYIIQYKSLFTTNKPIFDDDIFAYQNGPVVENVYYYYRAFGALPLLSEMLIRNVIDIDTNTQNFINQIINSYQNMSLSDIDNEITKKGSAWSKVYNRKQYSIISLADIRENIINDYINIVSSREKFNAN